MKRGACNIVVVVFCFVFYFYTLTQSTNPPGHLGQTALIWYLEREIFLSVVLYRLLLRLVSLLLKGQTIEALGELN